MVPPPHPEASAATAWPPPVLEVTFPQTAEVRRWVPAALAVGTWTGSGSPTAAGDGPHGQECDDAVEVTSGHQDRAVKLRARGSR